MNLDELVDENGLQQDEWSLTAPTFGLDNQLSVVGWSGKSGSNKCYILKCSKCSQDSELFGEGYFNSPKSSLVRGQIPCGCAKFVKWTEQQYATRCTRASAVSGNSFIGFKTLPINRDTQVIQRCPTHGDWDTSVMNNLLVKLTGCPKCKAEKNAARCSETYLIDEIILLQGFKEKLPTNLRFVGWVGEYRGTRTPATLECTTHERLTEISTPNIWFKLNSNQNVVVCPDCIFENIKKSNGVPEATAIVTLKQLVNTDRTRFNGFLGEYEGITKTKVRVMCSDHGETSSRLYGNLLKASHPCPICALGSSQIYAYVNKIMQGNMPVALKFGITGNPSHRLRTQNYANILEMENLFVFQFPSREKSFAAEAECKKVFSCGVLDKSLIPDGYTETTYIYNLDELLSIYKKYGGILL